MCGSRINASAPPIGRCAPSQTRSNVTIATTGPLVQMPRVVLGQTVYARADLSCTSFDALRNSREQTSLALLSMRCATRARPPSRALHAYGMPGRRSLCHEHSAQIDEICERRAALRIRTTRAMCSGHERRLAARRRGTLSGSVRRARARGPTPARSAGRSGSTTARARTHTAHPRARRARRRRRGRERARRRRCSRASAARGA
jgi:hypothetical protein